LLSSNREEGRERETKRETAHEEGDTHVLSNWLLLLWVCAKCSFGAHLFVGLLVGWLVWESNVHASKEETKRP
jgi:hypothetical protein